MDKHLTFFLTNDEIAAIETALAFILSEQDHGSEAAFLIDRSKLQTALATVKAQAYVGVGRPRRGVGVA